MSHEIETEPRIPYSNVYNAEMINSLLFSPTLSFDTQTSLIDIFLIFLFYNIMFN